MGWVKISIDYSREAYEQHQDHAQWWNAALEHCARNAPPPNKIARELVWPYAQADESTTLDALYATTDDLREFRAWASQFPGFDAGPLVTKKVKQKPSRRDITARQEGHLGPDFFDWVEDTFGQTNETDAPSWGRRGQRPEENEHEHVGSNPGCAKQPNGITVPGRLGRGSDHGPTDATRTAGDLYGGAGRGGLR